jgi:hypothetical protein
MESIIARAADGDVGCDRFLRAASAAGLRARLEDLAASSAEPGHYASELLAEMEITR